MATPTPPPSPSSLPIVTSVPGSPPSDAIEEVAVQALSSQQSSAPPIAGVASGNPISVTPPIDLREPLKNAKKLERQDVLQAYQKARADFKEDPRFKTVDLFDNCIPQKGEGLEKFVQERSIETLARQIAREAKRQRTPVSAQDARTAARTVITSGMGAGITVGDPSRGFTATREFLQPILQKIHLEKIKATGDLPAKYRQNGNLSKNYKDFCTILKKIDDLVREPAVGLSSQKLAERNKKILKYLRMASEAPGYRFLCTNDSIPGIAYFHRLVMASYLLPKPLATYQEVGMKTYQKAKEAVEEKQHTENLDEGATKLLPHQKFSRILSRLYQAAVRGRVSGSNKTIEYIRSHPLMVLSSLQSETKFLGQFDPRMQESAVGTSFTEKVSSRPGSEIAVSGMYSPTPTIGNRVDPVTVAFLEKLENNNFLTPEELAKEPSYGQATHWTFSSLQNIDSKNEGPRARALMELNSRFPISSTWFTVTQDSDFYLDGVHGGSQKKNEQAMIENGKTQPFNNDYKSKMFEELIEERGYVFPEDPLSEDAERAFNAIVDGAFSVVSDSKSVMPAGENPHIWEWKKKAAFRELVNLGVIRYWQMRFLSPQGWDILTACCKECVDRGGKVMAELQWALGDGSEGSLQQALYALLGRGFLSRDRTFLPARIIPFVALTEFVDQKEANLFLTTVVSPLASPDMRSIAPAEPAVVLVQ